MTTDEHTEVLGTKLTDEQEYEDVVRRHEGLIRGEISRAMWQHRGYMSTIDEDDIMTDVLLSIWGSLHNMRRAENRTNWLRALVRYTAQRSISKEMNHTRRREEGTIDE